MRRRALRKAIDFLTDGRATAPAWARHPSIQGFGIARGPSVRRALVLKVYVDRHPTPAEPDAAAIPDALAVPGIAPPVPIDVEAIGRLRLQMAGAGNFAAPDISISRQGGGGGTGGCIVADHAGTHYLLSNAHVMAWHGDAPAQPNDPIVCPAIDAGGDPATDTIATLVAWSPKEGEGDHHPVLDAAIARLTVPVDAALKQRFGMPSVASNTIVEGMDVQYSGARSGPGRAASVKTEHFTATLSLEAADGGQQQFTFTDVVMCQPACVEGDSGAAVYRPGNPPLLLGLMMAASEDVGVFCRIDYIFKMLGVGIATGVVPQAAGGGGAPVSGGGAPAGGGAASSNAGGGVVMLTVDQVVKAFNDQSIRASVTKHLPLILAAMQEFQIADAPMLAYCLGTIKAETASFEPITEGVSSFNSSDGTFKTAFDRYDNSASLGNGPSPDGMRFRGRGFIQLTGRGNYTTYGARIGLGTQLLDTPDLANDPTNAARLLAAFLADANHQSRIRAALTAGRLDDARRVVNGGTNGQDTFETVYKTAIGLIGPTA